MTAPALDVREHRAAIVAALTGPLNGHIYDFGGVPGFDGNPGDQPAIFAVLSVERRFAAPMHSARAARFGWRVSVKHVGRDVAEARWCEFQIATALDGIRLTVDGAVSTPVAHEVSDPIVKDDQARYSGLSVYTYAL